MAFLLILLLLSCQERQKDEHQALRGGAKQENQPGQMPVGKGKADNEIND
jgi:hypothetical protein